MKRYNYLGLNKDKTRCCLLRSLLNFSEVTKYADELVSADFAHDSTNWGGCDEVDSALKARGYKLTGEVVSLSHPLYYSGCDYDCGHSYSWNFEVAFIANVENCEESK